MVTAGHALQHLLGKSGEPVGRDAPAFAPGAGPVLAGWPPPDGGADLVSSADPPRNREASRCATVGGNFRSWRVSVNSQVKGFRWLPDPLRLRVSGGVSKKQPNLRRS